MSAPIQRLTLRVIIVHIQKSAMVAAAKVRKNTVLRVSATVILASFRSMEGLTLSAVGLWRSIGCC